MTEQLTEEDSEAEEGQGGSGPSSEVAVEREGRETEDAGLLDCSSSCLSCHIHS